MTEPVQIGPDVMALTERRIQHAIYREKVSACRIIMPNFTPPEWFECDVWAVTKAGFAHEYEVKLTRTDFLNDCLKKDGRMMNKHGMLGRGDERCPSRFWFVIGALAWKEIPESGVPAFAGIIRAEALVLREPQLRPNSLPSFRQYVRLTIVRPAPRLNRIKVDERVIQLAYRSSYYRYWNERQRVLTSTTLDKLEASA